MNTSFLAAATLSRTLTNKAEGCNGSRSYTPQNFKLAGNDASTCMNCHRVVPSSCCRDFFSGRLLMRGRMLVSLFSPEPLAMSLLPSNVAGKLWTPISTWTHWRVLFEYSFVERFSSSWWASLSYNGRIPASAEIPKVTTSWPSTEQSPLIVVCVYHPSANQGFILWRLTVSTTTTSEHSKSLCICFCISRPIELIFLSSAAPQVRPVVCMSSSSLHTFSFIASWGRLELVSVWCFGGPVL